MRGPRPETRKERAWVLGSPAPRPALPHSGCLASGKRPPFSGPGCMPAKGSQWTWSRELPPATSSPGGPCPAQASVSPFEDSGWTRPRGEAMANRIGSPGDGEKGQERHSPPAPLGLGAGESGASQRWGWCWGRGVTLPAPSAGTVLSGLSAHGPSGPPCVSSDSQALGAERGPSGPDPRGRDAGLTWLLPPRKDTGVTELEQRPGLHTEAGSGFPRSAGAAGPQEAGAGRSLPPGCAEASAGPARPAASASRFLPLSCRPGASGDPPQAQPRARPRSPRPGHTSRPPGRLESNSNLMFLLPPPTPHYTDPACSSPGFSSPDGSASHPAMGPQGGSQLPPGPPAPTWPGSPSPRLGHTGASCWTPTLAASFSCPLTPTQVVLHKQPEDLLLEPTHSKSPNSIQ